jgi:predicted dehydrogenase
VAHNRRFASATLALKEFLAVPQPAPPLSIRYHVQAGLLAQDHWLHDPSQGGRILGEVCHFVDWCIEMAGAPPVKLFASRQGRTQPGDSAENLHAVLDFPAGTMATITYETSAHPALPKETIQVSRAGCTAIVENFSSMELLSAAGRTTRKFRGKGQAEMLAALLAGMKAGQAPIPMSSWVSSARATLKLLESASTGLPVFLEPQS